jgi:hypothetical protein
MPIVVVVPTPRPTVRITPIPIVTTTSVVADIQAFDSNRRAVHVDSIVTVGQVVDIGHIVVFSVDKTDGISVHFDSIDTVRQFENVVYRTVYYGNSIFVVSITYLFFVQALVG